MSTNPLLLSKNVRQLGYTGSPLSLDEFCRLRQTIESSRTEGMSRRVCYPPVTLSCAYCHVAFTRPAYAVMKALRRGHKDFYCGLQCSMSHHATKHSAPCAACGQPITLGGSKRGAKYCKACKPKPKGRTATNPKQPTNCPTCNAAFLAVWRGAGYGKYQVYCGKRCAEIGHSRLMSTPTVNPKWKDGASLLRRQPHSARAFREMRLRVLERDGHRCVVCGTEPPVRLEVHHLDNWPMNNEASNLVTLCVHCHNKWHAAKDGKRKETLWPWLSEYAKTPVSMTYKLPKRKTSSRKESTSTTV